MSQPFVDDFMDMDEFPASFLSRLQPAGAFLQPQATAHSLQSPTALAQRNSAPLMTPLVHDMRTAQLAHKPATKTMGSSSKGGVAMSFMSAMRRGLDGLQDSDDEDEDEEEEDDDDDDDSGYYQPAYNQYHAPTTSFTGRTNAVTVAADDDELIFPMEM